MFNKLEKILSCQCLMCCVKNRVLIAIFRWLFTATPLLIVGSIFLLIANFPIPGWSEFWTGVFGAGWEEWFKAVSRATFNCVFLLTCLGYWVRLWPESSGDKIHVFATLVSFFILQPVIHDAVNDAGEVVLEGAFAGLSFDNIGTDGIFTFQSRLYSAYTLGLAKGWTQSNAAVCHLL